MAAAMRRCAGRLTHLVGSSTIRPVARQNLLQSCRWTSPSPITAITARSIHQTVQWRQNTASAVRDQDVDVEIEAQARQETPPSDAEIDHAASKGPIVKFADLTARGLVDSAIIENLTQRMGMETMTEVQTATINEALQGCDIIAQAKTGTGKTLAFLIPLVQRIILEDPSLAGREYRKKRTTAQDVRAIIISPTRELAEQIADEANKILKNTKIIVQKAVGGTQKREMLRKTQVEGCHVLVGTPGRLMDILSDPYSGVKAPALDALVLDEADRLLDQGFWKDVQQIQELLPDLQTKDRQTLMFSATVPQEVIGAVRSTLKPGFKFVKCVGSDDTATHEKIDQKVVHCNGFENLTPALIELALRETAKAEKGETRPFKAIVFYNSTADVGLASSVFRNLRGADGRNPLYPCRILDIHSRLTQSQRTRAAETFKNAESAILFSSDVTARGMDFPNVTHVIQVGLMSSAETYIHRVGRTGRAGKEGEGWLLVSKLELAEARRRLRDLPVKKDTSLLSASIDMSQPAQLPASVADILTQSGEAHKLVEEESLQASYKAQLGIFGWYGDKQDLVDSMNRLSRYGWGMASPPMINPMLAQRLGLSRIRGLTFGHEKPRDSGDRQSFGGRGGDDAFGSSNGGFGGRGGSSGRSEGGSFGGRSGGGYGGRPGGGFGGRPSGGYEGRRGGFGGRDGGRGGDRDGGRGGGFRGRDGDSGSRGKPRDDPFS